MTFPLRKSAPWNVLVFPGGTEIGLEINRALRDCKEVVLFSAGEAVASASEFRFKRHLTLPRVDDPSYLDELNRAIRASKIDVVFPAHDDVVLGLAVAAEQIPATVISSPRETCTICRSKRITYETLAKVIPVPRLFQHGVPVEFPIFVKPDRGQGSLRARRIDTCAELRRAVAVEPDLIICEFLPGREFTVDCFSSRSGGLLYCSGRSRIRTRAGISMQSKLVHDQRFTDIAERISETLDFHGPWFFQVKEDQDGTLKLLEIGPRVSGTMALSRVCGVNFPLLGIFEAAGSDARN
jgi:carbamoyl-phosphate synthase large subunit